MTKYVISDRLAGRYSERFDSYEDAERALRFFAPFSTLQHQLTGKRYEVLECQLTGSQWFILDPEYPRDAIHVLS